MIALYTIVLSQQIIQTTIIAVLLHYYNMSINRRPVNVTFTYTPKVRPVQHTHKNHTINQSFNDERSRASLGYYQRQPMQRFSSIGENSLTHHEHPQYIAQPPLQIKVSSDRKQQIPLEAITRNLITQVTKSISEITKAQVESFKAQINNDKQIGFKNKITIKKPLTKQFVKQKFAEKSQNSQKRVVNRYSSLESPKRVLQRSQNDESNFLFQLFNMNKRQDKSQMKDFISTNWKQSNQPSLKQVENNANQDSNTNKLLKQMVREIKQLNENKKQSRTVELQINFDQCPADDKKREREHYLKESVAKIISTVISVGFNMHYKQGVQFQKVKAYCSQNFLFNFCKLVGITKLNRRQMKIIEQHLQEDVLRYLNLSYPRSQQKQINKQLKSKIDEKDTFNQNRFDIVYNSKVSMSTKSKDNNSQIMKIMNYIIKLPDQKVTSNEFFGNQTYECQTQNKTLYEMFEEDMAAILNRVYRRQLIDKLCKLNRSDRFKIRDAIWEKKQNFSTSKQLMEDVDQQTLKYNSAHLKLINDFNQRKTSQNQFTSSQIQFLSNNLFSTKTLKQNEYKNSKSKLDENKEKQELEYRDKVQSYTKFKIGRKIQSNVQPYTQQEIQQGALIIKDSSVARVLMKWVEALETQIQEPSKNTYGRDQPYRLNNQQQTYLLSQQAQINKLYNFYDRSANVVKQQSQILKNNARQLFLEALKSADLKKFKSYRTFSSQRDAKIGHICTLLQKCKENHISSYLNMVINEIKYIQQQYQDLIFDKKVSLSSRPSLITMKLGDLMRCQITSKPKEIVAIYQYICILCKSNTNRFELVRVKDRLNTTNKDILLNIFYHKRIMIEIQLAIKNESAFISCSDKFSHFLYEMMRAFLGPINEICSIWSQYSPKAPFFVQKFQQINIRAQQTFSPNCIKELNHDYENERKGFKLPFWCSTCGILYHNDSVIRKICRHCKIYKCGICEIKANSHRYIEINYPNFQLITIPQVGKIFYALDIGTNHVHIKTMIKVQINGKIQVFSMKIDTQSKPPAHKQDSDQEQFELPLISNIKSQYEVIKRKNKNQADLNRLLFQQTHIILGKKDTLDDDQNYEQLLTNEIITKIVSEYYLSSRMKSVTKKYRRFLKLSIITNPPLPLQRKNQLINSTMNRNEKALDLMEKLNLNQNGLSTLNIANKMRLLRVLALCNNLLTSLNLEGFQNLIILELSSNKISNFQQLKYLYKCKNLKKIFLDSNTIKSLEGLPEQLNKLQILSLKKNNITTLTHMPSLKSLICLNLNQNKVNVLNGIQRIKGLQQLRLKANSFIGSKGVQYLKELKQLKKLDLSVTNLSKTLCQSMALGRDGRLQQIFIQTAPMSPLQLQPLMALNTLMNLEQIDLSNNFLKFIPQISKLKDLKELNLSHNTLQTVKNLQFFTKLVWLNLKDNKINNLDGLGSLRNLKWLDLSENAIQSKWLPKISQLINLQQLELSQNELTSMEGIGGLKNLYELSFKNNFITNLKGLEKLVSLEHLDASYNKLESLTGIQNLSLLIKLKLSSNKINNYKQLENVQNLKILELNWAGLDCIQKIPKIKSLQQLYLNHNQLKTLKGIGNFESLKKLQITFNSIDSIEQIKQLRFLGFFSFTINQHLKVAILGQLQTLQMVKIHRKIGQQTPFQQQQILIGMVLMGCQVQYEEM